MDFFDLEETVEMGGGGIKQKFIRSRASLFEPVLIDEKTDVVLISPDHGDPAKDEFFVPNVNNGLFRIAAYLAEHGHETPMVNVGVDPIEPVWEGIAAHHPPIVGFSPYYNSMVSDMLNMTRVREISPETLIVIGGFEASLNKQWLEVGELVDVVVLGEGEYPLLNLIQLVTAFRKQQAELPDAPTGVAARRALKDWLLEQFQREETPGVYMLDPDGVLYYRPLARIDGDDYQEINLVAFEKRLDQSPFQKFLDLSNDMFDGQKPSFFRFVSSDHCPLRCTFCQSSFFYSTMLDRKTAPPRQLSPESVVRIVRKVSSHYPTLTHIYIDDENFLLYKRRAKDVARALIESRKRGEIRDNIRFLSRGTARSVDTEVLGIMKQAGWEMISIGSESYSDTELAFMNKSADSARNADAIRTVRSCGLGVAENYILYSPVTTVDTFYESVIQIVENLITLDIDGASTTFITPLAGTPLWGKGVFELVDPPERRARLFPGEVYFSNPENDLEYVGQVVQIPNTSKLINHPEVILVRDPLMRDVSLDAVHGLAASARELAEFCEGGADSLPRPFVTLANIYSAVKAIEERAGEKRWADLKARIIEGVASTRREIGTGEQL